MSTLPTQSEARELHIRLCKQYQVDSLREAALALAEELQYVLSMVDELEPQPDTSSPSCYYSADELEQERQALCRQLGISRWC